MKNKFLFRLKSKVKLTISGPNINRFIVRLNNNNVDILSCTRVSNDVINIVVYFYDYEKVNKLKTIYNIDKVDEYGLIKIKKNLCVNKYIILSMVLGYVVLILLCNIIYEVDIVYNDEGMRSFLRNELKQYGIKEKTFKKSYDEIEFIKNDILDKHRDKLEWLEIERVGTKYVVRVESRIINDVEPSIPNRNIVAVKDAVIRKIEAYKGQIVKEVNDYVKKGDVIIGGNILVNGEVKSTVGADGRVFGEVWYETSVSYPFIYNEVKLTDDKKKVLVLKILNRSIELTRKRFDDKKIEERVIARSNVLPFLFVFQNQTRKNVIEQVLTSDEAILKARDLAIEKINKNLSDEEYIINYKILNTSINDNELELNMFFSVYEDITDYQLIQ